MSVQSAPPYHCFDVAIDRGFEGLPALRRYLDFERGT